jgi:hypothetical protein
MDAALIGRNWVADRQVIHVPDDSDVIWAEFKLDGPELQLAGAYQELTTGHVIMTEKESKFRQSTTAVGSLGRCAASRRASRAIGHPARGYAVRLGGPGWPERTG